MTRREKVMQHLKYGWSIYGMFIGVWWALFFARTNFTSKYEPLWWVGIIFSAMIMFSFGRRVERTAHFIADQHSKED